ncbi:Lrp/AsnC family transcriptional regulator [Candidatus Woesearchaeota archaeon]|nr:Lrp/AsnC family transcriptional regulator [Candidatus Woesearchaeota archaeon]
MKVLEKSESNKNQIQLDLKDKKILKLLSINARFSLSRISKYVRLTRDAVKYRINRLEKNNVITGYLTLINLKKLGFSSYHIFTELHPNIEKESEMIMFFKENKNINAVLKYSGKLDYELALVVREFEELDHVFTSIINKYPIKNYEILILLKIIKSSTFPEALLDETIRIESGKNDGSFFKNFMKTKNKSLKIDKNDINILELISNNARIPMVDISKKLNMSQDSVSYKIKNMIENTIILEFRPAINYSILGYYVYTVLLSLQNLDNKNEEEFKNFLKNNKNVLWAVKTIGRWNFLVYVITKNEEEFHKVINQIRLEFPDIIRTYETLLANEEYKYTYFPEIIKERQYDKE